MTISTEQLAALRAETPSCENILHFNNAGASLMPDPVYQAVTNHLSLEREIGGYEAAASAQQSLDRFYHSFAELLRVQPGEIAYVENATRAWDMAFYALPLQAGDRIITHDSEYVSNYLAFLQLKKRRGIEIDVVPSDSSGQVDVDALPALITPNTKLIAITYVPTQGGLVNPVQEIGAIARNHGLVYMLDACQAAGQIDVDVSRTGCHILSGCGRKFLRGPRGTGFLYVSNDIIDQLDPPFIDLHAATWTAPSTFEMAAGAKRFENWESYVAGRVGLAAAVDYAMAIGLDSIEERVQMLAEKLRHYLGEIEGISVHDQGTRKCGIVTFAKAGKSADEIAAYLKAKQINVTTSTLSSAQLDFGTRGISSLLRASVHYFNSEEEIERFCGVVAGL